MKNLIAARSAFATTIAISAILVTSCNTTTVELPASKGSKTKIVTKDEDGKKYKVKYKNDKPTNKRKVKVLFKEGFTTAERAAVLKGVNNSLGAKKYKVKFEEHRGSGYPSGKFVTVKWFSHTLETKVVGHHGTRVNGFYMTGGFRLIGINDKLRGKSREIQYVCEHEADHAFGRMHLSARDQKGLEMLHGKGRTTQSMNWGDWPSSPSI